MVANSGHLSEESKLVGIAGVTSADRCEWRASSGMMFMT